MRVVGKPAQGVIVTLARHERKTPASVIINKVKASKVKDIALQHGIKVRYEPADGDIEDLYEVPPSRVATTAAQYFGLNPQGYAK